MSNDPHAPTPAGPDPDEQTEVHPTQGDAVTEPTPVETDLVETEVVETAPATPAEPVATEDDWLKPDAEPAPDPIVQTPSAFTPPGTPEDGGASPLEKAKALTEKPEAMVGLAFLGGAVVSFLLKRLGR